MIKLLFPFLTVAFVLSAQALCAVTAHADGYRTETVKPANAAKKLGLAYEAVQYLNKPEKALSLLYNLENEIPELREYVFFIRGRALGKLKDPLAAEMYRRTEFDPSNPLRNAALEKEAEMLENLGLVTKAEEIYKTLLDSETGRRKDLYLKKIAKISTEKGNLKKSAEIWELIWKNHPASGLSDDARDEITALGFEFSPSAETRAARADRLFQLKKWKKALSEYESLPHTPERNVRRAVCLYITGRKDPEKLKKALALLEDTSLAEGLYRKAVIFEKIANISGNSGEKRKKLSKAAEVFKSVHGSFPDSGRAGESLIRAQRIMLTLGDTDKAESIYLLIKKSHPTKTAEAAWNLGWAYYKTGKYGYATRIFKENSHPENSLFKGQFTYWTARIFEKTGRKSEAQTLFLDVASHKQFSYYSFLASQKTGYVRGFSSPETTAETVRPGIKKARLLVKAGLDNWAVTEARRAGRLSPQAACEIFAALKRFNLCIALVGGYPVPQKIRLSFPKGFESEVEKFSAEYGLDEALIYSLIREESRFDMTAVSHANAFGLMQLIMSTAKEVAGQAGMGTVTREKLFLPEVNIKLGSRYLAAILNKFKGDSVAALAGYNAGPSRVGKWKKGPLKNLEPDEFTEEIPFKETRNYVRRIFRSYGAYTTIYRQPG